MGLEEESCIPPACGNPKDNQEYNETLDTRICNFEGKCKYKVTVSIFRRPICTYSKKESGRLSKVEA